MADRSIVLRLRAEYQQAVDGFDKVGAAAERAGKKIDGAERSSKSGFGSMLQHARENQQAWTTAGTALTVVGGAITAVGAAAAKTGIEYNTLQQTSRAAMNTLMGGAKEANAQMDKLDEFARKSPFAKQVFIQAQQQMIGFGIEAKKAIPYLEAIQDAVAATGGSNQQIAEISTTISKIQSAAKITAQDLIEFGNRGIDAATLIGSQMGKTGAQIREDITAGSLDATEALDALVAGMSERFGGAAANVKDTFAGAFDRVKAAWRDLSASIAEPLVGPEGGGLAIAGLNKLADALRAFESLPAPIRNTGLALAGLGGAASLGVGGFLLLMPKIVEIQGAFDTLSGQKGLIGKTARGLEKLKPAAKIAGGALAAVAAAMATMAIAAKVFPRDVEVASDKYQRALERAAEGSRNFVSAIDKISKWEASGDWLGEEKVTSFGEALNKVANADWYERLNHSLGEMTGWGSPLGELSAGVSSVDQALAGLVESGKTAEAAAAFADVKKQAEEQGISMEKLKELFPEYVNAAEEAGTASESAADGIGAMSPEAAEAQQRLTEYADALREGAEGFLDFASSAKDAKLTLSEWINDMAKQVEAQQTWFSNLETLMQRGAPQEFIDFLMSLGEEGAFRVKQLADASDAELQRAIDKFNEGQSAVDGFVNSATGIPDIDLEADATTLQEQVDSAKTRLDELNAMEPSPIVAAQITALEEKIKTSEAKLKELTKDRKVTVYGELKINEGQFKNFPDRLVNPNYRLTNPQDPLRKVTTRRSDLWHDGGFAIPMAYGGLTSMQPIAQMVPPNTWRVVGDRMDVDEAFIPLDGSRRSWRILAESMRRMPGVMPMAAGGVASAQSRVDDAQAALTRARRQKSDAKSKAAKQAAERRVRVAQDELDAAKRSLAAAKKRAQEDERAAKLAGERRKAEQERSARVNELRADFRTDVRRGSLRDQVTGGLSGAYSAVDRMFGLGKNEDLSQRARSIANSSARRFEASLRRLYGQAEKLDARLKDAKDKASELEGIQKSVASGLLSGRKLDLGDYQEFSGGRWDTHTGVAGANRRMSADVGQLRQFADKLTALRKAGVPGAILQEIAAAGPAEGITLADAFLGASKSDRQSYIGLWSDYEKQANRIGQIVTEGFHKGGVNAAQGVVKGIESQKKNVESQIASLARQMEAVFKQVLGIRSPSTVMAELGANTAEGLTVGIMSQLGGIQAAAAAMADAAIPSMGAIPVTVGDLPEASTVMADMSAQTLTAMQVMRDAVSLSMTEQQAQTETSQQGMATATQLAQKAMGVATQTSQAQARQATAAEQATMLTTVQTNQAGMLADTRLRQSEMLSGTRTSFAQMRATGITETQTLRNVNAATQSGMRADHAAHMSVMRDVNRAGFHSMRDTGVTAFRGLRDGMHGQMQAARPVLGSDLNRLIDVLGKFTKEVNGAFGDVGVKLSAPKPIALASGGVLPGYTPGKDVHHFRSRTGGDLYLSGGEAIMRPEFTRMVGGADGVKAINRAARAGDTAAVHSMMHFAHGGVIPAIPGVTAFADSGIWRPWWALVKNQFPQARLHSAYRPGSITATGNRSHHGAGRAIDITPSMAIFNWLAANYGPQLAELIFSPAGRRQLHRGRPHMYTGVTRAMHFDHIHLAAMRPPMGAGLVPPGEWDMHGGGFTPSYPFLDKVGVTAGANLEKAYRDAAAKHITRIRKNISLDGLNPTMAQMARGIMDKAAVGLVGKAAEYGKQNTFQMPGGSGVGRWRDTVIQALQRVGLPTTEDYISAWLRQIQTESGGNPRAIQGNIGDVNNRSGDLAHGLVQVIGSTFRAFRDKSLPNDRFHPLANLVAGMNWAKFKASRRGRSMLSFIGKGHGYQEGTEAATRGWALVGEQGPELVHFHGGEQVIPNSQLTPEVMSSLRLANTTSTAGTGAIDYDRLAKAVVDNLPPSLVVNNDNAGLIEERIAKKTVQAFADTQALYGGGF
ncbi:tape measure protein [Brevibacterium otitidis]|uniref:Tape measure protein n=1 Tax=Brevibacterium otitidis TaxID=53364 RepID=A0ABV5X0Y1_9MICO|nr:hypothetical protein GCM10023233_05010 [Brevibacterium otitidis]